LIFQVSRQREEVARGGGRERGTYAFRHGYCVVDNLCYHPPVVNRARRYLYDLLVSSLDRALALPEMRHVSLAVADDLDFDVAEAVDCCFFGEEFLRGAFLHGALDGCREGGRITYEADASTAASVHGFHHDGVPHAGSEGGDFFGGGGGREEGWGDGHFACVHVSLIRPPGHVGRDIHFSASSLALNLSPVASRISQPGPITTVPASSHILFANSADSERKP
jgi:hypothetical protein